MGNESLTLKIPWSVLVENNVFWLLSLAFQILEWEDGTRLSYPSRGALGSALAPGEVVPLLDFGDDEHGPIDLGA